MGYTNYYWENKNNKKKLLDISREMKKKVKSLINFLKNWEKEITVFWEISEVEWEKNNRKIIFDIDKVEWEGWKIDTYSYLEKLVKEINLWDNIQEKKWVYPFAFELEIDGLFFSNDYIQEYLKYYEYKCEKYSWEQFFFKLTIKVSNEWKPNLGYFHIDGSSFTSYLHDIVKIERINNESKDFIINSLHDIKNNSDYINSDYIISRIDDFIWESNKLDYYQYNVWQANASKISVYTRECKKIDLFFDLGIDNKKRINDIRISNENYIFISHWHTDHFRWLHKNINKFDNTDTYLIAPYDAGENPNLISITALHLLLNFIYKFWKDKLFLLNGDGIIDRHFIKLKKIKENSNNKNNNALVLKIKSPWNRTICEMWDYWFERFCREDLGRCLRSRRMLGYCRDDLSILFTWDASTGYYADLFNNKCLFIFNVPHHGSRHSYDINKHKYNFTFVFSFISYWENRYGHPNDEVLRDIREKSCILLKTKNFWQTKINDYCLDYLTTITTKFVKITIPIRSWWF